MRFQARYLCKHESLCQARDLLAFRVAALQHRYISMVQAGPCVWHLPLPEPEVGEAACLQHRAGMAFGNSTVAPGG